MSMIKGLADYVVCTLAQSSPKISSMDGLEQNGVEHHLLRCGKIKSRGEWERLLMRAERDSEFLDSSLLVRASKQMGQGVQFWSICILGISFDQFRGVP
jgi:hypothetical protein